MGEPAAGDSIICVGTDQTLGTQGKYMGVGQQAGEHDTVAVVIPFPPGASVVGFSVKVPQGNSIDDGFAVLYHDWPDGVVHPENKPWLGELLTEKEQCVLGPTPRASTCNVVIPDPNNRDLDVPPPSDADAAVGQQSALPSAFLDHFDSVSIFVNTTGGSFAGGSACIVLEPPPAVVLPIVSDQGGGSLAEADEGTVQPSRLSRRRLR